MASPPTTQIHPTEEELVPLSSSIGQLNELQFNPAPGDEVAVDAADPAVEWLKTRGFVPVPDDRFPGQLVLRYPGRTGHDDEAFKDEETSVAKEDLLRHPVRTGDHDEALKNEETSVTTVAKEYLLPRVKLPLYRRKVVSKESVLWTDAPVWTVDREWRVQNDKQDMYVFVNNGLQELNVDATFRSAHTKQAEATKLRLTLERLCFGVDGCAINESTTRGYFVYQIEIEAKPMLPIPLYSATPEANKFSVQRTDTSNASVTGSFNLSGPLQISVGSTRELGYSQESHRFLPARINGSSVTWKWQMLLWEDGQKFDTDNPSNFKIWAGIPHLPLDPSSVQLMKEIKETECIWEVQNEMVESEPTLEFEIEIEIRLFAAHIHKKISLGALKFLPKKKIKIFCLNSMIKIRPT